MCASYGLKVPADAILNEYAIRDDRDSVIPIVKWLEEFAGQPAKPTGNKALNLNPVVREHDGSRHLELAWWGIDAFGSRHINSRDDRLSNRWRPQLRSRRALVPVTRYFEPGASFDRGGEVFSIAAIYDRVIKPEPIGETVAISIATTSPITRFAHIHDRMPLLVAPDRYDDWLDPEQDGDSDFLDLIVGGSRALAEKLVVHETEPRLF